MLYVKEGAVLAVQDGIPDGRHQRQAPGTASECEADVLTILLPVMNSGPELDARFQRPKLLWFEGSMNDATTYDR
jgi:hypothetical protein